MRKTILFALLSLLTISANSQLKQMFAVKGNAKLISHWNSKKSKIVTRILSNGDKIQIYQGQLSVIVAITHKGEKNQLESISDDDRGSDSTVINVYEYDFGNDGEKEIMLVYSSFPSVTIIEVFRHSGGLTELIGKFSTQFDIVLDKNIISLPTFIAGQELTEYLYKKGKFYELVYHNPNQK